MRESANRISEGSAFEAAPMFHVSLVGSLHHYKADQVAAACAEAASDAPIPFHFVKWELAGGQLRAIVASPELSALAACLGLHLPLGRPWSSFYVSLGSVANIAPEVRADFLAAVVAAFPIDQSLVYHLRLPILYNEHNVPPPKRLQEKPKKKSQPAQRSMQDATPHRKWVRHKMLTSISTRSSDRMDTDVTGVTEVVKRPGGIVKPGTKAALKTSHRQRGPLAGH